MKTMIKRGVIGLGLLLSITMGFAAGMAVCRNSTDEACISVTGAETDVIAEFRQERQQLRQLQLTQLNEIIHDPNSSAEMISMAQEKQIELMTRTEQEMTLENLLAMRDFRDAAVTVHADSVNIMVRAEAVNARQAAVICELASRETGIFGGNVKIIPIK